MGETIKFLKKNNQFFNDLNIGSEYSFEWFSVTV